MLYIFALFLLTNYTITGYTFFYLIMYSVLSMHVFLFLFLLNNKEIKFLTDLQIFEQNIVLAALFITTIVAMSGLPPFIGFWVKLSVILNLISGQEFFIALLGLAVGLFLMFFYLQNYRFSGNLKFSLSFLGIHIKKKVFGLHFFASFLLYLNFIYIFFVNDFLN